MLPGFGTRTTSDLDKTGHYDEHVIYEKHLSLLSRKLPYMGVMPSRMARGTGLALL